KSGFWYDQGMLTLYRRHISDCRHRSRRERRCSCPMWVQGTVRGQVIRKALDLTSWEAADQVRFEMESGRARPAPIQVKDATTKFLADVEARKLSSESAKKYKALCKDIEEYAADKGFRYLSQFDLQALRDFRATWTGAPITTRKKLERLRSFMRFALESKW